MPDLIEKQKLICKRFSSTFMECEKDSKVGIALQTIGRLPLNALRIKPEGHTWGWYIWADEYSDAPDFFQPLHNDHLTDYVSNLLPYLGLESGWRVLLANEYEDAWYAKIYWKLIMVEKMLIETESASPAYPEPRRGDREKRIANPYRKSQITNYQT